MKIVSEKETETELIDLSGGSLFPSRDPEYGDFETIRSSGEYLVSSLSLDEKTTAYRQIKDGDGQDVDTFVMQLDSGDTYQIVFTPAATSDFLSNRGMTVYDAEGGYLGLILNTYGDTFSDLGTLTSEPFTAGHGGDYLLFAKLWGSSGTTAAYGLTLEKIVDETPWEISLERAGMGARAVIVTGGDTLEAGTQITLTLEFAGSNVTLKDVEALVSGAMSTSSYSTNDTTTISVTMAASQALYRQSLLEVSFGGSSRAGSLEVTSASIRVGGASVPIDIDAPVQTPGDKVLVGTRAADLLTGDIGDDLLSGLAANDTLIGAAGDDTLNGGAGADLLRGGTGNDLYIVTTGDKVRELAQQGTDTVRSSGDWALGAQLENLTLTGKGGYDGKGNSLANVLVGNAGNNRLEGLNGHDRLDGGKGQDTLDGGRGNDNLNGGSGDDSLIGAAGKDHLNGGSGRDSLDGGTGNDSLAGASGNDRLLGGAGKDSLNGGSGADILDGGAGRDLLYGGVDKAHDVFVFGSFADSGAGAAKRDQIFDFRSGRDEIDLSALDANSGRRGNQDFAFSDIGAQSHSVWSIKKKAGVLVRADHDGDAKADLEIWVNGISHLTESDFLL